MDSWIPSSLSAKKLITSFSLVCLVLSIPLFYLLYESYNHFKDQYQVTLSEIKGEQIIDNLLNELTLLSVTEGFVEFERGKKEIKEELISRNVLNLSAENLKEIQRFFNERENISKELAQSYYNPLINFVANHSNLVLDPDLDSYYFMDILIFRLPRLYSRLSDLNNEEIGAKKTLEEIQSLLREIDYSLKTAISENKARAFRTHYNFPHTGNFQSVVAEVNAQFAGRKKIQPGEIALRLQVFQKDIVKDLQGILLNRNDLLKKNKDFILMITLGFWFFGIIVGYFLFVKILKDYAEIFKRYTSQLQQLEESKKLSFVGEIASSIAHEVKNPLTIIDFEAASVRKNLNSDQFDKERAFTRLTRISEMSSRINKISNLVTIFTRKSNNDPFENVPFKKILDDVLYLTQLKAQSLGIPIQITSLDCDLCCRVFQLEQVFINLVNNSIDAIEPLSEKWIKIIPSLLDKEGEQWIVVRIVDSGRGIKKEVANNMFNSFFTTKSSGKGTGLGLSLVLRIIEDHRGKFYYDEHSEHTTFVLEIPRVQPLV